MPELRAEWIIVGGAVILGAGVVGYQFLKKNFRLNWTPLKDYLDMLDTPPALYLSNGGMVQGAISNFRSSLEKKTKQFITPSPEFGTKFDNRRPPGLSNVIPEQDVEFAEYAPQQVVDTITVPKSNTVVPEFEFLSKQKIRRR